ncbi:MAG: type I-D CRISPR-associated protein Cas7/Csc2, partial [Rhabdochlamydiaceae bacterium]
MSVLQQLTALSQYRELLQKEYQNFPYGKYVSLLLIRKTESETIFRTEGSGEGLAKEYVKAGLEDNRQTLRRVVISKRKQTAVERRTGRELLREHDLLRIVKVGKEERPCSLNTNA